MASINSFAIVHDINTQLGQTRIPFKDVKVYFPIAFINLVLRNAKGMGFKGSYQETIFEAKEIKVVRPSQPRDEDYSLMTIEQGIAPVPAIYPQPEGVTPKYLAARNVGQQKTLASREA